jgi:acyl-CoA thioester hydrolase
MATEQALRHRIAVRWSDMDALGHVNNSRYFTYLEEARLAWFESLPEPWYDDKKSPVVARASCDFRLPITENGTVLVTSRPGPPGNSSLTLHSEITDEADERTFAVAEIVLVWIDRESGRACPLPEALRRLAGETQ